jgi:hypothetical protein
MAKNTDNPNSETPTKGIESPWVKSKKSGLAPFDTLYSDFNFEAFPVYNYWTSDEITNDEILRGTRDVTELPRFVKLVWSAAPDLPNPYKEVADKTRGSNRDVYAFGMGGYKTVISDFLGMTFAPSPLQPLDFATACKFLSDGYIAAGVTQAVVESPVTEGNSGMVTLDEDQFLSSDIVGVTFNELDNALQDRQNSAFGAQQQMFVPLSNESDRVRNESVTGQFGLSRTQSGYVNLVSANPSSPALSVYARSADRMNTDSYVDDMIADFIVENDDSEHAVNVNFVDSGYENLFDESRVNRMRSPEHAENMIALATHADNLVVLAESGKKDEKRVLEIPSFAAPANLRPLEYVGYVIEKYQQENGAFKLLKTIYVPGREYTEYYDIQARYGAIYRYRIRGVVRWVRPRGFGVYGQDPTTSAAENESITSVAPNDASFFGTEWSKQWSYAAIVDTSLPDSPDELRVIPRSSENSILVSFKMPGDPQLDICGMKLLRKIRFQDGSESEWSELATFGPSNSQYVDTDVEFFDQTGKRYVYSAVTLTRHDEISFLSEQIAGRITSRWEKQGELPIELISCVGVDMKYSSGIFSVRPQPTPYTELISESGKVTFKAQERKAKNQLQNSFYTIRLESLDTGESVDVPLQISLKNLPPETIQSIMAVTPSSAL